VAEELALHQLSREPAHVEGDERLSTAPTSTMEGMGDELFSNASLTTNEHRPRQAGDSVDPREDAAHRLRACDDAVTCVSVSLDESQGGPPETNARTDSKVDSLRPSAVDPRAVRAP
jgi:hypothetical protein